MGDRFVADPVVLNQEGRSQGDLATDFVSNQRTMDSTVNEMLSSAYMSPGARAIGEQIASYKDTLDAMGKVIHDYSEFCLSAGNKVTKNEDNIIDSIKPHFKKDIE